MFIGENSDKNWLHLSQNCHSTHGIQPGADDSTVQAVLTGVPHQFGTHLYAATDSLRSDPRDLQAQGFIENNGLFRDVRQYLYKFGLECKRLHCLNHYRSTYPSSCRELPHRLWQ